MFACGNGRSSKRRKICDTLICYLEDCSSIRGDGKRKEFEGECAKGGRREGGRERESPLLCGLKAFVDIHVARVREITCVVASGAGRQGGQGGQVGGVGRWAGWRPCTAAGLRASERNGKTINVPRAGWVDATSCE